jgi:hypothetical protein
MPETFDLVLKGGEVVNQDGSGQRDCRRRGYRLKAPATKREA